MKKKYTLLVSGLALLLPLTACNGNTELEKVSKISLGDFRKVLEEESYEKEVLLSETSFHKSLIENNNRTETRTETGHFFKDNISVFEGNFNVKYTNSSDVRNDNYVKVAETKIHPIIGTAEEQAFFYLVTDYENEEYESTKDSAYRIPISTSVDSSLGTEGVDYLLEKDVPGQLSKQVTLLIDSFIATNLTNNINVSASGANFKDSVTLTEKNNELLFEFEDFGYEYLDDDSGINTRVVVDFTCKMTKDFKITTAETILTTTESRGSDSYEVVLKDNYELTYVEGSRKNSSTFEGKIIDGADYFLREVNSCEARSNKNGSFVPVSLDALPVQTYVRFYASDFSPSKAVDTELFVKNITNDTNNSFKIESGVLYVNKEGECDIELQSKTGVTFKTHVSTATPVIESLTFYDVYAGYEILDDGTRKAYAGESYQKNSISVKPKGCNLDDVAFEISDPSALKIEEYDRNDTSIYYRYTFADVKELTYVSVKYYLKSNPSMSTTIKYVIDVAYTPSELREYVVGKSYTYYNIFTYRTYTLTFLSETEAEFIRSAERQPEVKEKVTKMTWTIADDYKIAFDYGGDTIDFDIDYKQSFIAKDGRTVNLEEPDMYRTITLELKE